MNADFDILFISEKRAIYNDLVLYLAGRKIASNLRYVEDIGRLRQSDEAWAGCQIVICDPCGKEAIMNAAAGLVDKAPAFLPVVAIKNGTEFSNEFRATPAYQRLTGVVGFEKGWNGAWNEILKLRTRWKSPAMHSRIEDVSPGDVLQMIGVSQWTSIVRLEGTHAAKDPAKKGTGRIRGCISFSKGIPENAWSTCHVGAEAVWELLSLTEGILDVILGGWTCDFRNLTHSIDEILLAFALGQDEAPRQVRRKILRDSPEEQVETVVVPLRDYRIPPAGGGHSSAGNKPVWAIPGQRPALDGWWRRARAPVAAMLAKAESGSFPLRWLSGRELERIASGGNDVRFLSLSGDAPRLSSVFNLFARGFEPDRLTTGDFPTIRLGKFDTACLYLAGTLSIEAPPDALRLFPFIIWTDDSRHAAAAQALRRMRCPEAIFISDDPAKHSPVQTNGDAAFAYCVLPASREEWRDCTALFGRIVEALAVLNGGKEAF